MRLNREGIVGGVLYLVIGLAWAFGTQAGPPLALGSWFVAVAAVGGNSPPPAKTLADAAHNTKGGRTGPPSVN